MYPAIQENSFRLTAGYKQKISELLEREITKETAILTSLNRYERKKNIPLALRSFAYYL